MVFPRLFLAAALLTSAAPLSAQFVQPLVATDADALADQMRRLGANPLDLDALLTAGELSLRLDDLNAAGAFFSRAEKIDPRNGRAKAGEGALLVRTERPGEALRLFAQAEAMGLSPTRFAADRGLAYDLIGDQVRAQRDYTLALSARADDETRRRYALSLAISGKQAQALDQLAPLIRQNDRAAWRSRAFILAMGGDGKEASRIAQTMMPPGSAAGLQGFFAELPRLPPIDRAFAVHFGEVHPTAARLADARLAPSQAALPAEVKPVQVAAVPQVEERGRKRKKDRREPQLTIAALPPVVQVVQAPVGQPPAYQPRSAPVEGVRTAFASPADRPLTPGELASLNAAGLRSAARSSVRPASPPTPGLSSIAPRVLSPTEQANRALATTTQRPVVRTEVALATPATVVPAPLAVTPAGSSALAVGRIALAAPAPAQVNSVVTVSPTAVAGTVSSLPAETAAPVPNSAPASVASVLPTPVLLSLAPVTSTAPVPVAAAATVASPAEIAVIDAEAPPAPIPSISSPADIAVVTPPPVAVPAPALPRVASMRPTRSARSGRAEADSILARIVANLAIPASELGVEAPGARPQTAAERRRAARATERQREDDTAEKPSADRTLLATKKAIADKKAAADKQDAKEAADAKKASRSEPGRIWVQVAGGANEGDLDKAWSAVRKKAPSALAGKQAWTTPLRATNRVLTGPFKTDAEARAYVNNLARSGVSAFTFTSEAGQKVSRLPAR